MTDFHELYKRYADDIYRFALYLSGDAAKAEDITAETFARALTAKGPIDSSTVKGYLLTIARNLYFESLRHRDKLIEIPPVQSDLNHNPEKTVSQKTELEDVKRYLNLFPENDRAALLLRADGLPYSEISEVLNISLTAAKVKVHRLRVKLVEWRSKREKFKK